MYTQLLIFKKTKMYLNLTPDGGRRSVPGVRGLRFQIAKNYLFRHFLNTHRNFGLCTTGWKPLKETYTIPTKFQS